MKDRRQGSGADSDQVRAVVDQTMESAAEAFRSRRLAECYVRELLSRRVGRLTRTWTHAFHVVAVPQH